MEAGKQGKIYEKYIKMGILVVADVIVTILVSIDRKSVV